MELSTLSLEIELLVTTPALYSTELAGQGVLDLTMVEKFLMVDEVAEYLSLSKATLYQWASEKRIPHYKMGRAIRFKQAEIESWLLEKCKQEPISIEARTKKILRKPHRDIDINTIVKKAISEVKNKG
jgi:excisionase family DNA binding protein